MKAPLRCGASATGASSNFSNVFLNVGRFAELIEHSLISKNLAYLPTSSQQGIILPVVTYINTPDTRGFTASSITLVVIGCIYTQKRVYTCKSSERYFFRKET